MPQALSNSQVQTKFKQQNKKKRQTNATGDKWLTTTITKGTREKLLPSLERIPTENLWRLRK
jgi:hypothetical protein